MTMTIITQTEEIVNYSNLLKIYMAEGTYGDADVFAIVALPIMQNIIAAADDDNVIQLGIYDSEDKCRTVYEQLKKWLTSGVQPVFDVPVTVQEE